MVSPSQTLQLLKRIFWIDTKVYSANAAMKAVAEDAVRKHYDNTGLEKRGAEVASIRYLSNSRIRKEMLNPSGLTHHRGSFHATTEDPEDHLTVDFQKSDGTHVTTHHVGK
jgi:hypothetical protein